MISKIIPGVIPFINFYIYKLIIDLVVAVVGGAPFDPTKFYSLIGFRILTYFILDASFKAQEFVERVLWSKVPIVLNQIFFNKLTTLDIQYFENDEFRNLLEKAQEGYGFRPQVLLEQLFYAAQSLVQLILAFIALYQLNWFFVILISFIAIPEFINQTFQAKISWGIWDMNSPYRKRHSYLTSLVQGFREVKEIRIFRIAQKLILEIKDIQEKFYKDNKKIAEKNFYTNLIYSALSTTIYIGIELFVVFEALAKRVTVGDISFYTGVVSNF